MIKRPLDKASDNYKMRSLNRNLSDCINKAKNLMERKSLTSKEKDEFQKKILILKEKRALLREEINKISLDANKEVFDLYIANTDKKLIETLASKIHVSKKQSVTQFFSSLKQDDDKNSTDLDTIIAFKNK